MDPASGTAGAAAGPEVGTARVTFRVPDPDAALQEVRLYQEVQRPRVGPAFTRVPAGPGGGPTWELDFPGRPSTGWSTSSPCATRAPARCCCPTRPTRSGPTAPSGRSR